MSHGLLVGHRIERSTFGPGRDHYVASLGKPLDSHRASLSGVSMGTSKYIMLGEGVSNPAMGWHPGHKYS